MHYLCKGCVDACKSCVRCCDNCCKTCDDCCHKCTHCCDGICKECCGCCDSCCKEFSRCCEACFNGIMQCFSAPFSFCAFCVFFVSGIPFILAIIAVSKDWATDCDKPISVQTLIEGICNLLNFLFCIYLCFRYGKTYQENKKSAKNEEKNIMETTKNLILYDFIVCFYIFFLVFFLVWTIIGSSWISSVSSDPICNEKHNFLLKICLYNIIVMWIFLVLGGIIFIFTLLVYACEDGSCQFYDLCRCMMLVITCGFCDIGKRVKTHHQPAIIENQAPQVAYQPNGWIVKSKNILGKLGILAINEKKHTYQQPNLPANQMVVINQNYNQNYNNDQNQVNQNYNNGPQTLYSPQYNPSLPYNPNPQYNNNMQYNYNNPQYQGGYQYPPQHQVVNVNNLDENVPHENEKEGKKGRVGQIKDNIKHFKDKIKKYF